MMSTTKAKIAVIGLGNIGNIVAANLVKGGRAVIIADRKPEKAQALAGKFRELAQPMSIPSAIKAADIVVLAVWFHTIKEVMEQYSADLEGKIIVDPSNPIAPDENGGFKKIIDANHSAGQINSTYLPKNAKLVKALGTLGTASLGNAAFRQPEKAVLFYATDDLSINTTIEELISDSGFTPLRIGGIDQAIRIEVFGDLHEFGALGKTVSVTEASEKL